MKPQSFKTWKKIVCAGFLLVQAPYSIANDYNETCDYALQYTEARIKNDCGNNPTNQECINADNYFKANGGNNLMSYCAQAKLANLGRNYELAKTIIFTVATAQCTSLLFLEASVYFNTQAKLACSRTGAFAGSAAIATDLLGTTHINSNKEDFGKVMDGMNKDKIDWKQNAFVALGGGLTFAGKFIPSKFTANNWWEAFPGLDSKQFDQNFSKLDRIKMDSRPSLAETNDGNAVNLKSSGASAEKVHPGLEKAKQKLGCLICSLSFGYLGLKSGKAMADFSKSRTQLVDSAKELLGAGAGTVTGMGSGFNANNSTKPTAEAEASAPMATNAKVTGCLGPKQSSDAVLNCLAKQVPEVAAITANPELRNEFKRALKGKDLGDVINNYDEKSSVQDYVAKAMGLPNDFVNKSVDISAKIAEPKISDPNLRMAYTKAGGGTTGEGGSKFASSIVSNLKDTTFQSESSSEAQLSPEQEIFRRLDLMDPVAVFNDKKISLFIRIAHRYHKRSDVMDPTLKPEQNRVIGSKK